MKILLGVILSIVILSSGISAYAFFDFGGWEKKYNLLFDENKELKNEIEKLELEISKILKLYDTQKHKIDVLNNDVSNLEHESAHWEDQTYEYYDKLLDSNVKFNDKLNDYNELVGDYNTLDKTHDRQISDYNELVDDYSQVYNEAYKPRTEIDKTKVKWTIQDSKGNSYRIIWDFKKYEDLKVHSDYKSTNSKPTYLNLDGERIATINLEGFVRGTTFGDKLDPLYDNSKSNSDFIWEVWYIVSQMTIYDRDVDKESEGRYALETLVRQGGDCEDLVILIAEMIKSSSYTKDWVIQYIYMDSDNPQNPQTVNHVILSIDDGDNSYLIEATVSPNLDYYPDGITGWVFDV